MANRTSSEKNKPSRKTLRDNEYYNPKTKRYEYRYQDMLGKEHVVSSYRLEPADKNPKGKRSAKSLREKEEEIIKSLNNNIDIVGSKLTLIEVVRNYLDFLYNKKDLAENTIIGYEGTLKLLKEYKMGHMALKDIKTEHCEEWLKDMKTKYNGS